VAISRVIPPSVAGQLIPVTAAGTVVLQDVLPAGIYTISTTTQTITALRFRTVHGFDFITNVTGGQGFISIPVDVIEVVVPSGLSYPFSITITPTSSYRQLPAPAAASWTWGSHVNGELAGTITFTPPAGAVSMRAFWVGQEDTGLSASGTISDLRAFPAVITAGETRTLALAAVDANGVQGRGVVISTGASPIATYFKELIGTGSFIVPAGVTSISATVVGAGGGIAGGYSTSGGGFELRGAGGGGGVLTQTVAVTPGQSLSFSTAAASTGQGGSTTFAGLTSGGGGSGATVIANAGSPATRGGGGGGRADSGGGSSAGAAGLGGGFAGAAGVATTPQTSGGGGGMGSAASARNGGNGLTIDGKNYGMGGAGIDSSSVPGTVQAGHGVAGRGWGTNSTLYNRNGTVVAAVAGGSGSAIASWTA
jgi:hypothetical protein